ncbi:hypothetical protein N3K66_004840 [Trichothecium roseum]|uniref:Uncharacterized protein n=1 Tax=Trichothecium roseum TaxID=47278 RepID=A0ACC0V2C5_9HYPO|nr:hypothetical protein N3K66_004840 [Trichothecium roseum]
MSRRLVNRSSAAASSPRPSSRPSNQAQLPPYEEPRHPFSQSALEKLGDLSRDNGTNAFSNQIKETLRNLGHAVYDMHLRLEKQRQRLEYVQTRREQRREERSAEEEKLHRHVGELEAQVAEMTATAEDMVRGAIDMRVELEDDGAVLRELYTEAATQQMPQHQPTADEPPPPVPSTLLRYKEKKEEKKAAWESLSAYERYALDNEYAAFKKLWHEARAGDDGPPLPDASRWFNEDGAPIMDLGEDDGDDDADLVLQREHLSLKCPLTFTEFIEPYSNKKCKHTFEKEAILDYLRGGQVKQCPQTGGCPATFTSGNFNEDFFLDHAMLRRVQRAQQAEKEQAEVGTDDSEQEEEQDISVMVQGQRRVGKPKAEK